MAESEQQYREVVGLDIAPNSTGLGPDYPSDYGGRERGKFRHGKRPRETTVAVVGDDGEEIGASSVQLLDELIREVRLLRLAMQSKGTASDLGDLDDFGV